MNQIRWYMDEDAMAHAVVAGLRARSVNVMTTHDAGLSGSSDQEQPEFAVSDQRVLYSFNVADFCRLHSEYLSKGEDHSGIVVVPRQRYGVRQQIQGLLRITSQKTQDEMFNNLVFLKV